MIEWVDGSVEIWMLGYRDIKRNKFLFICHKKGKQRWSESENWVLMIFRPEREDAPDGLRELSYGKLLHFSSSIIRL